jgi:hypothetical protein
MRKTSMDLSMFEVFQLDCSLNSLCSEATLVQGMICSLFLAFEIRILVSVGLLGCW